MKGRFTLLLMLLIGMFMLSFTSAYFEFDNYYTYNETSRTASFKNGLTLGSSIAEIRLNTPLDMPVALGYNYVFELETWGDVDYSDFVRGIYVHDKKNGYSIVNRDIDLKYFNGYETKYINISGCLSEGFSVNGTLQCNEYGIIGTEEYQVEVWDDLLPRDLRKNDHLIIRGYTNVEFGDKMEWYIDFFGAGKNTGHGTKGVKEWAEWTADLNINITAYYKFEELSGPVVDSTNKHNGTNNGATTGVTGIILNGYDFDGTDNIDASNSITGSFSYSAWINPSSFPGSFQNTVIQGGNSGQSNTIAALAILNNHVWFRTRDDDGNPLSDLEGSTTVSTNNFVHIGVTYNAATGEKIIYLNGSNDGSQTDLETMTVDEITMGKDPVSAEFWDGVIDEVGIWGRVLTPTEMVQLFNGGAGITFVNISGSVIVTLNSPENNTIQSNTLVEFNWTITPDNTNITNWTLSVFFENGTLLLQEVNTSINTNETTVVLRNETISDGNYVWNVESCVVDGDDVCVLSENRTFSIDTLTPLLNITSPVDGFIVTDALQNISINFTINDSGGTLDQCWLNTSLNSTPNFIVCADNVTSALYPASAPDSVTLFLSANDTAGNVGTTNVTVFKNTVAPIVNITAPEENFTVTQFNQSIDLNWTVSDNATLDSCFYTSSESEVTEWKYQESANITNQTGVDGFNLNYTGLYSYPRIFDNNTFDINYTKPINSRNTSLWVVKLDSGIQNLTIPSSCWNYNVQTLSFRVNTPTSAIFGNGARYACNNGTDWLTLANNNNGGGECGATICDDIGIARAIDGSWSTFIRGSEDCFDQGYTANDLSCNQKAKIWEEAMFWETSEDIFVNCSDNTTIINYPSQNPDNQTITFFAQDTFGNTGSDDVTIFKNTVAPIINITAPAENLLSLVNGQSLDLNFTITNTTSLDICLFEYNSVNTSVTCSENVSTTFTYVSGINAITVFVNDTLSNFANASRSFVSSFNIVNESFEEEILVSETNDFRLDVITTASSITSPELIYDGVSYSATLNTINSTNFFLTASVITFGNLTGNNTFFWNVTLDGQEFSSSDSFQNVSNIEFIICDGSNNVTFFKVNFTDEATSSSLNATIRTSTFDYWIDDEVAKRTYLFGVTTNSSDYEFCFAPSEETINIDASISYNADGYPERTSSVVTTLNNVSTNVTLSLLSVDDGLYATFTFVDSITKVGLDSVTVEISESGNLIIATVTDSSGSISEFLNPNILYQIDFSKTGYASGTQNRRPISTDPLVIEMDNELFEAEDELTNGLFVEFYPSIRKLDNDTVFGFGFFASEGAVEIATLVYTVFDEDGVAIATVARSGEGNMTQTNLNTSGNGTMTIIAEIYGDDGSNVNYTAVFEISNFQSTRYSLDQWGLSFDGYFPTETRTTLTRFIWFFLWFIIMLGGFNFGYNGSFKQRSDYTDNTSAQTRGNTATGLLFAFLITLVFSYFNFIPAPFVPGNGSNIFTNGLLRQNFFAALLLIPLLWDLFGASVSKHYRSGN